MHPKVINWIGFPHGLQRVGHRTLQQRNPVVPRKCADDGGKRVVGQDGTSDRGQGGPPFQLKGRETLAFRHPRKIVLRG